MNGKKVLKITILLAILAVFLYIGDIFLGNPISYGVVKWHSQKYLKETYPSLSVRVEDIYHDWYNGGGYDVRVISDTSRDTRFELIYSRLGQLEWDGYAYTVASGRATLSRLYEEYAALVAEALSEVPGNHGYKPGLSTIDEYTGTPYPLPVGIDMSELELDGDYDVAVLGAEYGYLDISLSVEPEDLTTETVAEYLLRVKAAMEAHEVGFVTIDLFMTVWNSKDENESLGIKGITAEDLEAEDPVARLEEMRLEQLDYWNGEKQK